ncbi:MAG: alpha/beta fold hydrolase [Balneolaceae bacterium]
MKFIGSSKYFRNLKLEEFPEPQVVILNHPILLCHGYGGITSIIKPSPLYEVCMLLREHGILAFAPNIVPYAKIETRAEQWVNRIEDLVEKYNFEKLNLIAHSMGGLDLRYALTHTDVSNHIASITTVATPHRGTSLAEFVLDTPNKFREKVGEFFNWFGESMYPKSKSDSVGAIKQLTRSYIQETFNPSNPDLEGLKYYSYSAAVGQGTDQPVNPIYRYQNKIIFENEGANDTFVSVESAKWGEHINTIPLSHLEQLKVQVGKERLHLVENFWLDMIKTLSEKGL